MKKSGLILFSVLLIAVNQQINAQKSVINGGFSINLITGVPADDFGWKEGETVDSIRAFNSIWGLQIGNRWYFGSPKRVGLGLMTNWLDVTFAMKNGEVLGIDYARAAFDLTFMELGPVGTVAILNDLGIDAYYNLRPTTMISASVLGHSFGDETYAFTGFGFSHAFGGALRWRALNFGVEYVSGSINSKGKLTGTIDLDLDKEKISTNSVRFVLGFKF